MKNDCRFRWIFSLILALCLAHAPLARAQETEVEPNDPCSAAQNLTAASFPLTVSGSLGSPDIDFYRISATPGSTLRIRLEGQSSGQGTLPDPLLGVYANDCVTLLTYNDDSGSLDSLINISVPASGTPQIVVAATSYADFSFTGNGYYSGSYRLSVEENSPARSISGRVVDTESGAPVVGAYAVLYRCTGGSCFDFVGWTYTDGQGELRFENGAYNLYSPLNPGSYRIALQMYNYEPGDVGPFQVASGQELDLGDIPLTPLPRVGSIQARIVDAITGAPLPGNADPYPWVELQFCDQGIFCYPIRWASPDASGNVRFEGDSYWPLYPGTYQLRAYADQYETTVSERFEVGNGEQYDFGDFALKSFPVRINLVQTCGQIPASGGQCQFKMRVTNGAPGRFVGESWSIINGGPLSTPAQYTTFQAGVPKGVSLAPGASAVLSFSVFVPADLSNGAYVCAEGFAAQRPHSFNTLGRRYLFCLVKGAYGFSAVPEEHKRDAVLRSKGEQPPHPTGRP